MEELGQAGRIPPFFVRLWKLHGSVNWSRSLDGSLDIVRRGDAVQGLAAAIYPSDTKYEESRRVPFVVLEDRFRRMLERSETYTIISGYSLSDEHLNELIFDAAARRPRSEFAVFFYSAIPEIVAQRAETCPNLQVLGPKEAVLGGVRAPWRKPEDAPADVCGDRGMILGDFSHLAGYLARSAADLGYTEAAAGELPHPGVTLDSDPKDTGSRPEAADEKS